MANKFFPQVEYYLPGYDKPCYKQYGNGHKDRDGAIKQGLELNCEFEKFTGCIIELWAASPLSVPTMIKKFFPMVTYNDPVYGCSNTAPYGDGFDTPEGAFNYGKELENSKESGSGYYYYYYGQVIELWVQNNF